MAVSRINGFDAIRAVSVLLVILSHVGIMEAATNPALNQFFSVFNASFGVRCFFVLSGFLITTLLLDEHRKTGRVDIKAFMIRRALRIIPLYLLILVFLYPYFAAGRFWSSVQTASYAMFFAYNFIPKDLNVHYLSHLWSLGVEEQFYILWPLVFSLLASGRMRLVWICVAVVAACLLRMELGYGEASAAYTPNRWTIPAIYPIALGAMLAILMKEDWVLRIMRTRTILAVGVALICLPLFNLRSASIEVAGAVGIAFVIGWIYVNQESAIVRALEWPPLVYIGMISYGLYMWQGIFTGNGPYRQFANFPPDPLIGALITFPVAALSFHFFERPISRLRGRFRASSSAGPAVRQGDGAG